MKICVIARNINDDYRGSFEFDQAKALKKAGHDVYVISLDFRSLRRKRKFGIYMSVHDNIRILRCSIPIGPVAEKISDKVACFIFKKVYSALKQKAGGFDIIHSHFLSVSYICTYTLRDLLDDATPLVVTEHSSLVNKHISKIPESLVRKAKYVYNKADCVISVSQSLSQNIMRNFGIKSEVVYNVFDSEIFKYDEKNEKKTSPFIFVSTGNLTANKRMDMLIESFHKAFAGSDDKLYIFGDGPEKVHLKNLVIKLKMNRQVFLMGKKSRREIADFYGKANAFVLLSASETFGVAYIEAMAVGMPVIACRSGGPEDFIKKDVGLISGEDSSDSARCLIEVKRNIAQYDKWHISQYAQDICGPAAIAEKLSEIYTTVIERGRLYE